MNQFELIYQQLQTADEVRKQAVLYKSEVFTYFDEGLTRWVLTNEDKTKVVKFLKDPHGPAYNTQEVDAYDSASEKAKLELAETKGDAFIVEQEFCNPIKWDDRDLTLPQVLFARSCRNEVGWDADGNLKCFDLDEYRKY